MMCRAVGAGNPAQAEEEGTNERTNELAKLSGGGVRWHCPLGQL